MLGYWATDHQVLVVYFSTFAVAARVCTYSSTACTVFFFCSFFFFEAVWLDSWKSPPTQTEHTHQNTDQIRTIYNSIMSHTCNSTFSSCVHAARKTKSRYRSSGPLYIWLLFERRTKCCIFQAKMIASWHCMPVLRFS